MNIRVDIPNRAAEIGYAIGRKYWGQGITAEACSALVDWAFEEYDLARICARAELENRQSLRVMEKLGMQREGITRSSGPSDRDPNTRANMVTYAILRDEWEHKSEGESYQREALTDCTQ